MSPKAIKAALSAALALLLIGAGAFGVWSYNDAIKKAERLDAVEGELRDVKRAQAALNDELARRAKTDNTIRANRAATQSRLETVAHEDSTDGALLRQRIPDGVRDAWLDKLR